MWLEKARKSQSRSVTSTGRWGTLWAASMRTWAPTAWALAAMSLTGLMAPRTLDMWVMATSFV